jgi:hypothetical protein
MLTAIQPIVAATAGRRARAVDRGMQPISDD